MGRRCALWVLGVALSTTAGNLARGAPQNRADGECVPGCRSGFVCARGVCVSVCNPPCDAGERCTGDGECSRGEADSSRGVREHDGFYLGLGLGAGYLSGHRTEIFDPFFSAPVQLEGSVLGLAQVGEIGLGGTVARGLVLGGGAWGVNVPAATYDGDGIDPNASTSEPRTRQSTAELAFSSLTLIGPFLAWYPDPSRGLYGAVSVGGAIVAIAGPRDAAFDFEFGKSEGIGWGGVAKIGNDWWIGQQWSLGVCARLQFVTAPIDQGEAGSSFTAIVPALLGTVTFH